MAGLRGSFVDAYCQGPQTTVVSSLFFGTFSISFLFAPHELILPSLENLFDNFTKNMELGTAEQY